MIFDLGVAVLGGLASVSLGLSFGLLGWALAARFVGADARVSVRGCAAVVVALFTATALFWLLAMSGQFRLAVVLPLTAGLAALAWRAAGSDAGSRLRNDLAVTATVARGVFRTPAGWMLGALLALGGLALLRGLVAPPLGWDGLTYHLLKAGRFVQAGALVTEQAPDAWRYYEYFPLGGDLLWAWSMLPFRSGLLIVAMGVFQWAAAMLGLYATARELGAGAPLATSVATSVGAMPAMVTFLSSAYVDNLTLTFFALGTVFVVRTLRGAAEEAPLAAAALACMVGVRVTTLPLLALAGVLLPWAVWRSRESLRRRGALLLVTLAVTLVGAPTYLRAWLEHGSPFYPVRVVVAGHELSAGEPLLQRTLDAIVKGSKVVNPAQPPWRSLLYAAHKDGWYTNPGPGIAVLPLVAVLGVWQLARRRSWATLLWLTASALVVLGALWTDEMAVYRMSSWANTVGRLLLPGLAALALLGAAAAGPRWERWLTGLLVVSSGAGLMWSWPRGLSPAELPGVALTAAWFTAAGLVLVAVVAGWRRGMPARASFVAGVLTLALLLAATDRVRAAERYPLYEAAAQDVKPLYHFHPLQREYAVAWTLWRELDGPGPLRLAVFSGWDGRGHNTYRYPLLGSRLQNLVLYVPITRDGAIIDGAEPGEIAARGAFAVWVNRLQAAKIDLVVALAPANGIELHWVQSAPELFEPVVTDAEHFSAAYRFHPERLPPGGLPVPPRPAKAAG